MARQTRSTNCSAWPPSFLNAVRLKVIYTFDLDAEIDDDAGHATITETAALLALQSDRVDLDRLPPAEQPLGNIDYAIVDAPTFSGHPTPDRTVRASADPRQATSELGQRHFQVTVDRLAAIIFEEWHNLH